MKFCQSHWDDLRSAVDAVGLGAWVPESGERAARNVAELAAGAPETVDNFDPLMNAMWSIVSNMIEACRSNGDPSLGIVLIGAELCPLCLGNQMISGQGPYPTTDDLLAAISAAGTVRGGFDSWIANAAADQRAKWQQLGSRAPASDQEGRR